MWVCYQEIVNHLDQSLCLAQSKNREQQSDHIYYTLLQQVHNCDASFTSLRSKLSTIAGAKLFSEAKQPACYDFSSSDFNVQGHILSTGGDALVCLSSAIFLMVPNGPALRSFDTRALTRPYTTYHVPNQNWQVGIPKVFSHLVHWFSFRGPNRGLCVDLLSSPVAVFFFLGGRSIS